MLVVDRTGAQALLQDLGRDGHAHLGVSPSGAADRAALRLANRLVGNPEDAAAVECLLGGLAVTASALHWVAVTGAPTDVLVNGRQVGSHTSLPLRRGDTLVIEAPTEGLRSYLAIRGGFQVAPTLGSRSTDVLSGLGPEPLAPGKELPVGAPLQPLPDTDLAPVERPRTTLAVLPGPRRDWFAAEAWTALSSAEWTVTPDSDRVGLRLAGPGLARARTAELPSEGLVAGAVQVPPDGAPILFLADHPVTGGYPVLAVVRTGDLPAAAQLRPGDVVRFSPSRGPGAPPARRGR